MHSSVTLGVLLLNLATVGCDHLIHNHWVQPGRTGTDIAHDHDMEEWNRLIQPDFARTDLESCMKNKGYQQN